MGMTFGETRFSYSFHIPQYGVAFCNGVHVYTKIFIKKEIELIIDTTSSYICDPNPPCGGCSQTFTCSWREEGFPMLLALYDDPTQCGDQACFECICLMKTRRTITQSVSFIGDPHEDCPACIPCMDISPKPEKVVNKDVNISVSNFKRTSVTCMTIDTSIAGPSDDCSIQEETRTGGLMKFTKIKKVKTSYVSSDQD